jgi:hypothetical protein
MNSLSLINLRPSSKSSISLYIFIVCFTVFSDSKPIHVKLERIDSNELKFKGIGEGSDEMRMQNVVKLDDVEGINHLLYDNEIPISSKSKLGMIGIYGNNY